MVIVFLHELQQQKGVLTQEIKEKKGVFGKIRSQEDTLVDVAKYGIIDSTTGLQYETRIESSPRKRSEKPSADAVGSVTTRIADSSGVFADVSIDMSHSDLVESGTVDFYRDGVHLGEKGSILRKILTYTQEVHDVEKSSGYKFFAGEFSRVEKEKRRNMVEPRFAFTILPEDPHLPLKLKINDRYPSDRSDLYPDYGIIGSLTPHYDPVKDEVHFSVERSSATAFTLAGIEYTKLLDELLCLIPDRDGFRMPIEDFEDPREKELASL